MIQESAIKRWNCYYFLPSNLSSAFLSSDLALNSSLVSPDPLSIPLICLIRHFRRTCVVIVVFLRADAVVFIIITSEVIIQDFFKFYKQKVAFGL